MYSLLLSLALLLLATESTGSTLWRHTRDIAEQNSGQHDAKQFRELPRLRKNEPQQQLEFTKVLSNWDNMYSFFTQEIANKVNATYHNKSRTPCPWTYEVDHDFNRYPQYIHQARCSPSNNKKCYSINEVEWSQCSCEAVNYTMPVLKRNHCNSTTGEQSWIISEAIVYAACVPRYNINN